MLCPTEEKNMSKLFALHEHTLWVRGNDYENRIVGLVRDSMGTSALGRLHLCHDAEANAEGAAQLQSRFLGHFAGCHEQLLC